MDDALGQGGHLLLGLFIPLQVASMHLSFYEMKSMPTPMNVEEEIGRSMCSI